MLRFLRRNLTKNYFAEAMTDLSLEIPTKPQEEAEPPPKKVKFSLAPYTAPKFESAREKEAYLKTFPSGIHDLPEELSELIESQDPTYNLMDRRTQAYDTFNRALFTIPEEGVHYHRVTIVPGGASLSSPQLRSLALNSMRMHRADGGVAEEGEIPKAALQPHDKTMIKHYTRVDSEGQVIDVDHWARWYLQNQPEDISKLDESDWEPFPLRAERSDQIETIYSALEREELTNEDLNEEDGAVVEATDVSGSNNEMIQGEHLSETIMRIYDSQHEWKALPLMKMIENKNTAQFSVSTPYEKPDELPPIPPYIGNDFVSFNASIESWSVFKAMPGLVKFLNSADKLDEMFETNEPWVPVKLPSIYNYYETLPKYYQSQRLIQNVTIILEKYHPKIPRKKKETMLNRLCQLMTPRNPEKYKFLQEFLPVTRDCTSTNLKTKSGGDYDDHEPRRYEISSEGEIDIMDSQSYTASDLDPSVKAEFDARLKSNPSEDFQIKVAEFQVGSDGEIPEEFYKRFPKLAEKALPRLQIGSTGECPKVEEIVKQLYPENEDLDANVDLTEGSIEGMKFKKSRHILRNKTTSMTYTKDENLTHLPFPEEEDEKDLVAEKAEAKPDEIGSDIEIEFDKKTGTIKEMRTFKNIGYETNVRQLWKQHSFDGIKMDEEEIEEEELEIQRKKHKMEKGLDGTGLDNDFENAYDDRNDDDDDDDDDEGSDVASDEENEISGSDEIDSDLYEDDENSDSDFIESESEYEEDDDDDSDYDDDEEEDEEGDEDDDEEGEESQAAINEKLSKGSKSDKFYSIKAADMDPSQQLKRAMGEKIEEKADGEVYYKIYDRNVDWFTTNHENNDGPLPSTITFYDNDDGYWNEWIRTKRERAGIPELGTRPHFRH